MKVTGALKLGKQFDKIPDTVRKNLRKSITRNTEQAARAARGLVPALSGELKGWIFTQYADGGMSGSVEAAQPNGPDQRKASAVEFGRTKGNRGTTKAQPYIQLAQKLQGKKFRNSMKAAIKRGLKEATNG
jgi:hypothetical protein